MIFIWTKHRGKISIDENVASFAFSFLIHYRAGVKKTNPQFQQILPTLEVNKHTVFIFLNPSSKKDSQFFFPPAISSKKFFSTVLNYAANSNNHIRDYSLQSLLKLLAKDKQVFKVWKEVYPKYLAQSNNLLLFLDLQFKNKHMPQQVKSSPF